MYYGKRANAREAQIDVAFSKYSNLEHQTLAMLYASLRGKNQSSGYVASAQSRFNKLTRDRSRENPNALWSQYFGTVLKTASKQDTPSPNRET